MNLLIEGGLIVLGVWGAYLFVEHLEDSRNREESEELLKEALQNKVVHKLSVQKVVKKKALKKKAKKKSKATKK